MTSKALAGNLTTRSARELSFTIFVNLAPLGKEEGEARGTGRVLKQLCEVVYEHKG